MDIATVLVWGVLLLGPACLLYGILAAIFSKDYKEWSRRDNERHRRYYSNEDDAQAARDAERKYRLSP